LQLFEKNKKVDSTSHATLPMDTIISPRGHTGMVDFSLQQIQHHYNIERQNCINFKYVYRNKNAFLIFKLSINSFLD